MDLAFRTFACVLLVSADATNFAKHYVHSFSKLRATDGGRLSLSDCMDACHRTSNCSTIRLDESSTCWLLPWRLSKSDGGKLPVWMKKLDVCDESGFPLAHGSSRYLLSKKLRKWLVGVEFCESRGSAAAVIDSKAELLFLSQELGRSAETSALLGMRKEGNSVWTWYPTRRSVASDFLKWSPPSTGSVTTNNTRVQLTSAGMLQEIDASEKRVIVCECDVNT